MLAASYDAVVMNPPYMGKRGMNAELKSLAETEFTSAKSDLFAMFIVRGTHLSSKAGRTAMIAMHSWMFLSSFQELREHFLRCTTIETLAALGPRAFSSISGEVVQTAAFVVARQVLPGYRAKCFGLTGGDESDKSEALLSRNHLHCRMTQLDYCAIPGSPLAYWISPAIQTAFKEGTPLADIAKPRVGLQTGDNHRFLRRWSEVSIAKACFNAAEREAAVKSDRKWFPYNKGGGQRKWYGNNEFVVNWEGDGREIKACVPRAVIRNAGCYFQPSITWSDITTSTFAARLCPSGFLFDVKGSSGFPSESLRLPVLAFLCSRLLTKFMKILNPTTTFQVGDLSRVPGFFDRTDNARLGAIAEEAVSIAKADWDSDENSWDFERHPLISDETIEESFVRWVTACDTRTHRLSQLETACNQVFVEAYEIQDELSPKWRTPRSPSTSPTVKRTSGG